MIKVARNATHTCIIYDMPDFDNPREYYDPFGHMVCWHHRYKLGDKHSYESPDDFLEDMCRRYVPDFTRPEELTLSAKLDLLAKVPTFVILPLYLYDHSGISISTHSFNDPWDSGQIGWTYATPEEVYAYAYVEDVRATLLRHVEEYDCWLQNGTSGFELYENSGMKLDWDVVFNNDPIPYVCNNYLSEYCTLSPVDFEDYPGDCSDYLSEYNLIP